MNFNNRFLAFSNILVLGLILFYLFNGYRKNNKFNLYAVYMIVIWLLKSITEKLSKHFGMKYKDKYPLLQKYWPRPKDAKGCSAFDPIINPNKPSLGGGMPSGHSAHFAMYGTVLILNMIEIKKQQNVPVMSFLLVILLMIMVPISRVDMNCHTKEQVMIGFGLGVVEGLLFYWIEKNYLRKYERFAQDRLDFYNTLLK